MKFEQGLGPFRLIRIILQYHFGVSDRKRLFMKGGIMPYFGCQFITIITLRGSLQYVEFFWDIKVARWRCGFSAFKLLFLD